MENQKRPSFQFFPGDWRRDSALQSCSVGARGLWIEMMCIMHDGTPYGHLRVGGKDILPPVLARMVGASLEEVEGWLEELEQAGVFSRTETGTIYSRRMVRDEEIRQKRAAGGVKSLDNPNVPRPKKKEGYPSGGPSGDPSAGPSGGPLHLQSASASADISPSPSTPRTHAREEDLDRLRAYLGEHAGAVDRFAASAEHSPTWPAAILGLYGPQGTDQAVWQRSQPEDRPALLARALDRYAGEGKRYHGKLFRRFLEDVIDEHCNDDRRADDHRRGSAANGRGAAAGARAVALGAGDPSRRSGWVYE